MTVQVNKINIDLSQIQNVDEFHRYIQGIFGFPKYYGKNLHALIDCLSSLRYPEDEMSNVVLEADQILHLQITNLSRVRAEVIMLLIVAIEEVNNRELAKSRFPMICMVLI